MNDNKIALKCKELMLNENWSLRRCCRKFGVSRDWLRKSIAKLNDNELNNHLLTNDVEEIMPKEPAQMCLEDFNVEIEKPKKEKNYKSSKYLWDKNEKKPINPIAVKAYRSRHFMNQSTLAKMLGVDTSIISRIENGERKISNNIYDRLLNAVGMDVDMFNKFAEGYVLKTKKDKNIVNVEDTVKLEDPVKIKVEEETLESKLDKAIKDYNSLLGSNNAIVNENRKLRKENETLKSKLNDLEQSKTSSEEDVNTIAKQKKVIVKLGDENKELKSLIEDQKEIIAKLKSMIKGLL